MFEKFKNEDTDPEVSAAPEPEIKSFAEDIPATSNNTACHASNADAIIEKIVSNPENSAEFKGCNSSIWNEVWKGVAKVKLHPKLSWDSDSGTIRYR
tara:strand:- start:6538 stop:6828 length:291 start_codon:yes stop_codon:yes gene_type:complete